MAQKKSTVPGSNKGQITRGLSDLSDDINDSTVSEPLGDEIDTTPDKTEHIEETSSEAPETPPEPQELLSSSAAPASALDVQSVPEQEPAPKPKKSPFLGAVRPAPVIKNDYKGANSEEMKKEVVAYCLKTSNLRQGLKRWVFTNKVSYIVPNWFALTHANVFVIKGE